MDFRTLQLYFGLPVLKISNWLYNILEISLPQDCVLRQTRLQTRAAPQVEITVYDFALQEEVNNADGNSSSKEHTRTLVMRGLNKQ